MLMHFKNFVGPKEYSFKDPDTGYKYEADDFSSLLKAITDYRSANQLPPIEQLSAVVEHYLCMLPCHYDDCKPNDKLSRSFSQYVRGGVALLKSFLFKEMVSQEVADERAKQCAACTFNRFPEKNNFDAIADSFTQRQVGDKRSKYHNELGNCIACSCLMRSKVFYKGNINLTDDEAEKMELVGCWQLKHRANK